MESLKTATLCGISPLEFWELTPYEFSLMVQAYCNKKQADMEDKVALAYVNALWTIQWLGKKSNHPKPLKEILDGLGKRKEPMTDEQMLKRVKMLNAMFGGEVK